VVALAQRPQVDVGVGVDHTGRDQLAPGARPVVRHGRRAAAQAADRVGGKELGAAPTPRGAVATLGRGWASGVGCGAAIGGVRRAP
jgi:hypothetical protein